MRSRVIPGWSYTMARFVPVRRLNSADLPTLGRPTMATRGSLSSGILPHSRRLLRRRFAFVRRSPSSDASLSTEDPGMYPSSTSSSSYRSNSDRSRRPRRSSFATAARRDLSSGIFFVFSGSASSCERGEVRGEVRFWRRGTRRARVELGSKTPAATTRVGGPVLRRGTGCGGMRARGDGDADWIVHRAPKDDCEGDDDDAPRIRPSLLPRGGGELDAHEEANAAASASSSASSAGDRAASSSSSPPAAAATTRPPRSAAAKPRTKPPGRAVSAAGSRASRRATTRGARALPSDATAAGCHRRGAALARALAATREVTARPPREATLPILPRSPSAEQTPA